MRQYISALDGALEYYRLTLDPTARGAERKPASHVSITSPRDSKCYAMPIGALLTDAPAPDIKRLGYPKTTTKIFRHQCLLSGVKRTFEAPPQRVRL